MATGDVAAVRSAASLLADLEHVWRGRIARTTRIASDTTEKD